MPGNASGMTSLIPYHTEADAWNGVSPFRSLSPGELSKLCHLDLYASLHPVAYAPRNDDPVARGTLLHVYPGHGRMKRKWVLYCIFLALFLSSCPTFPCDATYP